MQEIELLKSKMQWELDYIQDEVFKEKVDAKYEIFTNNLGKRFLLWNYKVPTQEGFEGEKAQNNFFLTFVANDYVVGISTPSFDDGVITQNNLKQISENIRVAGYLIDLEALYYQIDAIEEDKEITYTDEVRQFEFKIPFWFTVMQMHDRSQFGGTFPDIKNIKNALVIQAYEKEDFKNSIKAFNQQKILKHKIGDTLGGNLKMLLKKELEVPKNINGISYKVQTLSGTKMYENVYYTLDTGSHFLFIVFTATPETFDINKPRLDSFISRIKTIEP